MREFVHDTVFLMLFMVPIVTECSGCGPDDHVPPLAEKICEEPITYQIVYAKGCSSLRPHLLRVWVFDDLPDPNRPPYVKVHDWDQLDMRVYWEIIARRPVAAEGFRITVGQVPDGFEQVLPIGQHFVPPPGRKYHFEFETDWPCYQRYGVDSGFLEFAEKHHARKD
jgi:hypothetical protein